MIYLFTDKSEIVEGFDITQPFEMKSAYGEPKFTNYTAGFSGCLDYIYYQSDKLKLLQVHYFTLFYILIVIYIIIYLFLFF